jgi:aminoglycoside phosphotransferase (APT) family kinase protein
VDAQSAVACLRAMGLLEVGSRTSAVVVADVSRRNRNFRVTAGPRAFLLKQARGNGDRAASGVGCFAGEADAYGRLWGVDPGAAAGVLPRLIAFDAARRVLVTELVPGEDLRGYHRRVGRFPRSIGRAIGAALAWTHRTPNAEVSDCRATEAGEARGAPLALGIHRPDLASVASMSSACIRLTTIVQAAPAIGRALDDLGLAWRDSVFVHGDVKWDNVVVVRPESRGSLRNPIRLVDWEIAGPGEPAWDVGSALAAYLEAWMLSLPLVPGRPPADVAGLAGHPLPTVRPAAQALWAAYADGAGLDGPEARRFLRRSMRFAAVRLLQTAYEMSQHSVRLNAGVVVLVQAAANILGRPRAAAGDLLGLP